MCIWFRHLLTDWQANRQPELLRSPFVSTAKERNCIIITAASSEAERQGISAGMLAADAKAIVPRLQVLDDILGKGAKLLTAIGEWCIRFTPVVAVDLPDGLILEISGCTHLWGGEREYRGKIVYPNNLPFDQLADQAKPYWKNKAWDYARLDQFPDQALAEKVFRISVNMGKFWTIAFLQRSFNVLNRRASYYFDLKVDGVAGPKTLSAILAYNAHEGNTKNLLTAVTGLQITRYIALGETNEKLEDFENGWLNSI